MGVRCRGSSLLRLRIHPYTPGMPHVLIIDSETSVAEAIDAELVSRGATVRVTGDGSEGLEYAKASAPDIIDLCVELVG